MLIFDLEPLSNCYAEAIPLFKKHWQEIAYLNNLKPDPEFSKYESLEKHKILRFYTARKQGSLIGYAIFFVQPHLHFKKSIFAYCDIVFILPKHRGFGYDFIRWCNDNLKREGTEVILYEVNKLHDYGNLLKRQGFKHTGDMYTLEVRL